MANHEVQVDGAVDADSTMAHANDDSNAMSVEHLRPLSEGVLHALGLHGGLDEDGNVADLRGKHKGAVDIDPATLPSDEPHVRKLKLEHKTGGMIERRVNADGSVTLRLIHGDGDVATAKAVDSKTALEILIAKMGGLD